jgi:hypothetical protein
MSEKPNRPNWQDLLESRIEEYAAFAWSGYLQYGRGALVVHLNKATFDEARAKWTIPLSYVAEDAPHITAIGGWPGQFGEFIKHYNPETQFVVVARDDGGLSYGRKMVNLAVTPPQACKRLFGQHGKSKREH